MFRQQHGCLDIILGPMYSGKTSRLVEIYKQCVLCDISVAVINHSADVRYDASLLTTHDKIKIPCIQTTNLMDILDNVASYTVVLINEGQFFEDLVPFVHQLLEQHKQIYVCGLDGDFRQQKFGTILDLIPLCDNVFKLSALCSLCKNGTKAIFSCRLSSEQSQTVIGSDNYIPLCRKCYVSKSKSLNI